jgi:methyl-accepting chemotaxis protein
MKFGIRQKTTAAVALAGVACTATIWVQAMSGSARAGTAAGLTSVAIVIVAFGLLGWYLLRMQRPVGRLKDVVEKMAAGDYSVRAAIASGDEFEDIGNGIDSLLGTRVSALVDIESENEQLNDSIVALLETVARLAQRDLTAKAKVQADVTGPIADALNMMAEETAKVLIEVTRVSASVAEASNVVKAQSDSIVLQARKERDQVEQTARELAAASQAMTRVARLAMDSSKAADDAIKTTREARATVSETVAGINAIRDAIREAEKRIKRLGERSQEISAAINLINRISERTQILALNAGMQAASGGDAGRGVGVVADEVQRLAENTRDATTEITTLVGNIQTETSLVANTMNDLITQVVEGSMKAEKSGEEMAATEASTARLVESVRKIAVAAVSQTKTNKIVQQRIDVVLDSVGQTGTHLLEQAEYTDQLLDHAMSLVQSVGLFSLPEEDEELTY